MPSTTSEPTTVSRDPGENLKTILARIDEARRAAVAPSPAVQLIAVSKTQPAERGLPVLKAGHRIFGENRVQEAKAKWPELRLRYPDIELHLIGPLQTNKLREALSLFDVIQSVDRPRLAEALKSEVEKSSRPVRLFVQ